MLKLLDPVFLGALFSMCWLLIGHNMWWLRSVPALPLASLTQNRPPWLRDAYRELWAQGSATAVMMWVAALLGMFFVRRITPETRQRGQELCDKAGWPAGLLPEEWLAVALLSSMAGFLTGLLTSGILLGSMAAATGLVVPLYLRRRWSYARQSAEADLPRFFDLLVLLCEAGQPVDQAIMIAGQHTSGILGGWLTALRLRCQSGVALVTALRELGLRVELLPLQMLAESIDQTHKLGTRIVPHLERIAQQEATRQLHRAEEKAQAAPVAILPALMLLFAVIMALLMAPFAGAL